MRIRAACAAALAFWMAGGGISNAASPPLERWRYWRTLFDEIDKQYDLEKEICRAELAAGVTRGYWSEAERATADDWIVALFQPEDRGPKLTPRLRYFRRSTFYKRLLEKRPDLVTYTYLSAWLEARLQVLGELDSDVMRGLSNAACDYAAEVWMAARQPSELEPAVRVLKETWALLEMNILQTIKFTVTDSRSGKTQPRETPPFHPLPDFYGVMAIDQPLVLPDPASDPVSYVKARRDYRILGQLNMHGFATYWGFYEKVTELDRRLQTYRGELWKNLETMVLQNAPADQFAEAFNQLPPEEEPMWIPSAAPPVWKSESKSPVPDYRLELLKAQREHWKPFASPRVKSAEDMQKARYQLWLNLRRAEGNGDTERIAKCLGELRQVQRFFPARIAQYLTKRLQPPATRIPEPAAATDQGSAVTQLIESLRRFPVDSAGLHDQATRLADAWQQLPKSDQSVDSAGTSVASRFWTSLAERPESASWFTLRDRAAKELLKRLELPEFMADDSPLALVIGNSIEALLGEVQLDKTARVLSIDQAATALPLRQREAYERDLRRLSVAHTLQAAQRPSEAVTSYRDILASSESSGAARFAAKQLRAAAQPNGAR